MTVFEYVSVTISIILGLAMARLLSGVSQLIIARKRTDWHWIPIAWAMTLFFLILVLWWQLFQVGQNLTEWTFQDFAFATVMTLPLYVSSALLLPVPNENQNTDLFGHFVEHGKWGVGAYIVFFLIAIPANLRLFDTAVFSAATAFILGNTVAATGAIISNSRTGIGLWTLLFVVLQITNIFYVLFPSY